MASVKCQGLHACNCVHARFRVTRTDLRVQAHPEATEWLCAGCLNQLRSDPSFDVTRIEPVR